jgi:hypothetical protein
MHALAYVETGDLTKGLGAAKEALQHTSRELNRFAAINNLIQQLENKRAIKISEVDYLIP